MVVAAVAIVAVLLTRKGDVELASGSASERVARPVAGADDARSPKLADPGASGARDAARSGLDAPLVAATDEVATATLKVTVLARSTRAPVADVEVCLSVDPERDGRSSAEMQGADPTRAAGAVPDMPRSTDADGVVEFRELPCGVALAANATQRAAPYASIRITIEPLTPGERRSLVIELPDGPDREFWLRVVDAQSGKPIGGARIFQSDRPGFHGVDTGWMLDVDESQVVTTDAEGYVVVQSASWRNESLHVDAAGFSPAATPIVAGHETREQAFVLQLERAAALVVRTLDPSRMPLAGLDVTISAESRHISRQELWSDSADDADFERTARTGEDGRARFERLPASAPLELVVRENGTERLRRAEPLRLEPETVRELELVLGRGATIAGVVLDQDGRVVAGLELWLVRYETSLGARFAPYTLPHAKTTSGADGRFRLDEVSAGTWVVGPRFVAPHATPDPELVAPQGRMVSVEPTDTVVELELVVARGLYLQGRVELTSGEPAIHCPVFAHPDPHGGYVSARSDEYGRFCLGPLAAGPQRLSAGGAFSGFAESAERVVDAGTSDLLLRVDSGGELLARFTDRGASADVEAQLAKLDGDEARRPLGGGVLAGSSTDGVFRASGLASGAYALAARGRNGRVAVVRFELAAGARVELDVALEAGASVHVKNRSNGFVYLVPSVGGLPLGLESADAGRETTFEAPPGALALRVLDGQGDELAVLTATLATGQVTSLVHGE